MGQEAGLLKGVYVTGADSANAPGPRFLCV